MQQIVIESLQNLGLKNIKKHEIFARAAYACFNRGALLETIPNHKLQ